MRKIYLLAAFVVVTLSTFAQVTASGLPQATYPSLAAAITALNSATISSNVQISLQANEVAPAGGYVITASGNFFSRIEIRGNQRRITASNAHTPGSISDAIFKIVGSKYVSITGFGLYENPLNTNVDLATNNCTEFGIALLNSAPGVGPENITINNNVIKLNLFYPNSIGVYTNSNHSSTNFTTIAAATSTGRNQSITITSNEIDSANIAIAAIGTPGFPSGTITIGGNDPAQSNLITNWGYSAQMSDYARLIKSPGGVLIANFNSVTVSNNNIASSNAANVDGDLRCLFITSSGNPTPGNGTLNVNFNVFSLRNGNNSGLSEGVRINYGGNGTTLNLNSNNFALFSFKNPPATGISNFIHHSAPVFNATINENSFSGINNNSINRTTLIRLSAGVPTGGNQTIRRNQITGTFTRNFPGLSVTEAVTKCISTDEGVSSGSNANIVWENNIFDNVVLNGIGSFIGIENIDNGAGIKKLIRNNSVRNITGLSEGFVTGMLISSNSSETLLDSVIDNRVGDFMNFGPQRGITILSSGPNSYLDIINNEVKNLTSIDDTTRGIEVNTINSTLSGNQIFNLTGVKEAVGIWATNGSKLFEKNRVYNIINNGTGTEYATGIYTAPGAGGQNILINNYIGSINTPFSSSLSGSNGLYLAGSPSSVNNIFYNTIYLNASSNSPVFGSTGIYFLNNSGALDLKNNIVMNTSIPGSAGVNNTANGITAVIRRNQGTNGVVPSNYSLSSTNNLYFSNTSGSSNNRLVYVEGTTSITNSQRLVNNLKAFLAGGEIFTFEGPAPFLSTTPGEANYLRIDPSVQSFVEGKGRAIGSITSDYFGTTRNPTTPDIGAEELNGTLPVRLTTFAGQRANNVNLLTWKTASETNNQGFEVMRSTNGIDFNTIDFVKSQATDGNSTAALQYNYRDQKVNNLTYYYQLKQIDLDGKTTLSNIIRIERGDITKTIIGQVYPNPANQSLLTMVQATSAEKLHFTIVDANGRIVGQTVNQVDRGNNTIRLNTSKLGSGIYTLKITTESGETSVQRFVKQ